MSVETVTQQISSAYRQLRRNVKTIWAELGGSWRGDNADCFEAQFWAQFERDIEDHLRALEALDEAINRARAEIND